jgi:uncharacterized protein involved in oxidation of intracellular sulfur
MRILFRRLDRESSLRRFGNGRSRLHLHALLKEVPQTEISILLMADSVVAAKAGQKTPDGYYNVERMLKRVLAGKGNVLLCGTCMDARGLDDAALMAGARRSTMEVLATTTTEADKVLVF